MKLRICVCVIVASLGLCVADPVQSVEGLISRVIGAAYIPLFSLSVIPADPTTSRDVFELEAGAGGTVAIRGNTGVSLASGLGWYLKYYVNASWSWGRSGSGNQMAMPSMLPMPPALERHVNPNKWRYYANVCTFGYSFAFWDWAAWEAEIDRLALWGINLPLSFTGQEYVYDKVYRSFANLTDADLNAFFSGPAFSPWQRMGNLQAWGGPLTPHWLVAQRDLQKLIVERQRSFGMVPVLAGFAGHVPGALQRVFPASNYTQSAGWGNFNATYSSDTLLQPTDPLFTTLGAAINKAMLDEFGDPTGAEAPMLNSDAFNEMDPSSPDASFLKASNAAVYNAMTAADPRATYVMQAWLFHSEFWNQETVAAYLSGVPIGGMLILDLNTDADPVWNQYSSFFGHQWLWNALEVYGGRRGIYGNLDSLSTKPYADRAASASMVGTGTTPEAIDEIPIVFDAAFETGWRTAPVNASLWTQQYAVRRYGRASPLVASAYDILLSAAYTKRQGPDTSSVEKVPEVMEDTEPGNSRGTNATGIVAALRLMTQAGVSGQVNILTGPWSYDLTDLTRQFLTNVFADAHDLLGKRWSAAQGVGRNNTAEVNALVGVLRGLIADLDMTNGADPNYLLGTWINDARSWASSPEEAAVLEFNARNQVTLWGPNGEIIDYAAKVGWAGLVADFYGGRWNIFAAYIQNATRTGTPPDWDAYYNDILTFSRAWGAANNSYSVYPNGQSPTALAARMLSKYASGSVYDTVHDTDAGVAPPAVFFPVGGDNQAAVSPDCPYIAHGDGDSLAACEASCGLDSACNVINYNAGGGDCVFRACTDPANPKISPTDGYRVYGTTSPKGADMLVAWHTDIGVLSALCDADPECLGFNSKGHLKANLTARSSAPGTTLYIKRGTGGTSPPSFYAAGGAGGQGKPILPANAEAKAKRKRAHSASGAVGSQSSNRRIIPRSQPVKR